MRRCALAVTDFLLIWNVPKQIGGEHAECRYAQKAEGHDGWIRQPRQFHGG